METGWRHKDEYTINGIREHLIENGLDAFIPWKSTHIAYLTNYYDPLHSSIVWEELLCMLIIPAKLEPFITGYIAPFAGCQEYCCRPYWLKQEYPCFNSAYGVIDHTIDILKKKGLDRGKIGIELKQISEAALRYLSNRLPNVQFISADSLVPSLRFIKNKREHKLMKFAADTGFRAMERYMQVIRRGGTMAEAKLARAELALSYGAQWIGGTGNLAWTGAIDGNYEWLDPKPREIFKNSLLNQTWQKMPHDSPFLVTHFEILYQSYYADLAFCGFYASEPSGEELFHLDWCNCKISYQSLKDEYLLLRKVQYEALGEIVPGMDQFEVKDVIDRYIESASEIKDMVTNYFVHGIGMEIHEEPIISSCYTKPIPDDTPIIFKPGAVVSSEWFSDFWTVEDPFYMLEDGSWKPLTELKELCDI